MIFMTIILLLGVFGAGEYAGRRRLRKAMAALESELALLRDPELLRLAELRKQMGQEQRAFNLLCNYGTELAYGQVSAADLLGKEGQV